MTDEDIATVQHSERLQAERGGDKPENVGLWMEDVRVVLIEVGI